jgi:cold shock protein
MRLLVGSHFLKNGKVLMFKGRIRMFNVDRGFGFIRGDDGEDYFFHASKVTRGMPVQGEHVTFEKIDGKKGMRAINVQVEGAPSETVETIGRARFSYEPAR